MRASTSSESRYGRSCSRPAWRCKRRTGIRERTSTMRVENLLRTLAPQVLGTLVRRHRQFDVCEDAVQEALLAASEQWVTDGVPDNPRAWLTSVASRRMVDDIRSETARRRREETAAALAGLGREAPAPEQVSGVDDSLTLLFLCCHPAVTPASQVALTLR